MITTKIVDFLYGLFCYFSIPNDVVGVVVVGFVVVVGPVVDPVVEPMVGLAFVVVVVVSQ